MCGTHKTSARMESDWLSYSHCHAVGADFRLVSYDTGYQFDM